MSALAGRLAEALRRIDAELSPHVEFNPVFFARNTARAALAEYEATPRGYIPADYIREKLEKYDAEIADGTVCYPFFAGVFSQLVRWVME